MNDIKQFEDNNGSMVNTSTEAYLEFIRNRTKLTPEQRIQQLEKKVSELEKKMQNLLDRFT